MRTALATIVTAVVLSGLPGGIAGGARAAAADGGTAGGAPGGSAVTANDDTPESLAVTAARRSGKPVDVPSMRTESSEVTAQPDGTLVSVTHVEPVRTRKNGAWVAIDPALHVLPGGEVAPTASLADLRFSGGGSAQPLVRMTQAGKELDVSWPKPLPTPRLDGDTATYQSVLPEVDLRLTATTTGFTQLIVVKSAEAAKNPELAQLKLGLSTDGLSVNELADGSLAAVDQGAGGTVFVAPQPMMYDSSAEAKDGPAPLESASRTATQGAPLSAAYATVAPSAKPAAAHAARVGLRMADDQKSMVLTPDRTLLDDPHTVFPVLIDPAWDTPVTTAWTGISRAYGSQPYWHFTYNSTYVHDFGTGYCASPRCSTADVKRVLYRIPVSSKFSGKHILSAEFNAYESYSYSCTAKPVQLWLTKGISSSTTWNSATASGFWVQNLQTITSAKGWSSDCPAGWQEFGGTSGPVKDVVQKAATNGWSDITFGLKASDEDDAAGWKRFTDDASLRVHYNLPPKQAPMSALSMSPGSVCQTATLQINKRPQVTAKVSDPDGEKLGVQFGAAWDSGDGQGFKRRWWSTGAESTAPASSGFKASGSAFSVTLPSTVPLNKAVGWEVRGWDGAEWGPWSSTGDKPTDCYFIVDTKVPDGPKLSSVSFPGSALQSDDLPWTDGVGRYGDFAFDSSATDVVKYQYAFDQLASSAHEKATTAGASQSVSLLMDKPGPHFLSARAIDGAGNASQPETYYFNVLNGHPQRAGWTMDDASGSSRLAGTGGTFEATLASGAAPGAPGHSGNAITFDGTANGYASTDGAVLDTSSGFTVSAWVNTSDTAAGHAAISQNGGFIGEFSLGLYGGKWTFKTSTKDADGYTWQSAASDQPVVASEWTHLAGVYNRTAKTLTVYVNGVASAPVSAPTSWNARGALQFGRLLWRGGYADPWTGAVDDIRIWDRPLTPAEAADVAADKTLTTGTPAKVSWPLDENAAVVVGASEESSATVYGGARTGVAGPAGKAVHFDGVDDYARTSRPQVDGTRSFSVSAWVRLPAPAANDTAPKMIVTQNGVHQNEFSLYYSPSYKKWIFGRYQQDTSADTLVRTMQPSCTATVGGIPCFGSPANEWVHLLGVSDSKSGRLRLFINGYQVAETAYIQTAPWSTPGPLQIGAVNREGVNNEFFGGDIDDVRVYDRVVTVSEAHDMVQQRPQLAGRWKFDTASGTPATSPDEAGTPHNATLYNQAAINGGGGYLNTGSLLLDGTGDYAATSAAPFHTGESFSIAGWTQTAGSPDRDMTVLSVGDGTNSAVAVRWDYLKTVTDPATGETQNLGQWEVELTDTDTAGATRTTAVHTFDPSLRLGYWNHLAVVYDAFADKVTLYVNGQPENQLCADDDTTGTCTDHVSWADAGRPFEATGGLQFGRDRSGSAWTEYFSGELDDVWAYQGVLSPAQIISLADPNSELDTATGL